MGAPALVVGLVEDVDAVTSQFAQEPSVCCVVVRWGAVVTPPEPRANSDGEDSEDGHASFSICSASRHEYPRTDEPSSGEWL